MNNEIDLSFAVFEFTDGSRVVWDYFLDSLEVCYKVEGGYIRKQVRTIDWREPSEASASELLVTYQSYKNPSNF